MKNRVQYDLIRMGAMTVLKYGRVKSGFDNKSDYKLRYIEYFEDSADKIVNGKSVFVGYLYDEDRFVDVYEAIFVGDELHDTYAHLRYVATIPTTNGEIKFNDIVAREIQIRENEPNLWFTLD